MNIEAIVLGIISLVQTILADTGTPSSSVITKIVSTLEQVVPVVVGSFPGLVADVKNIIADLKANSQTPAELMATLAGLDAQADSALDAAAKADGLTTNTGS